jgi:hypothetical protein
MGMAHELGEFGVGQRREGGVVYIHCCVPVSTDPPLP